MGQHRPLRLGGRARRVQQLHQVGVPHAVLLVDRARRVGRPSQHVRAVIAGVAVAQRPEARAAEPPGDRVDVLDQRRIDERRPRLGLRQQVGELVVAGVEVDRDVHEPGLRAAEVQQHVGIRVAPERRDPIAARKPSRQQCGRHCTGRAVELGVTPRAVGERQRHSVRRARGTARQHLPDGARKRRHGRPARVAHRGKRYPRDPSLVTLSRTDV